MKKLELTEEERQRRKIEQQIIRNKRYREKNNIAQVRFEIDRDKLDEFETKLQQDGLNKKQFFGDAIDTYLNKKSRK